MDIDLILRILPPMAEAAAMTMKLFVYTLVLGLVVAAGLTAAGFSRLAWVRFLVAAYISVMRGTPLLVQLFVVYFGGPQIGLHLEPITAGVITMGANIAAYMAVGLRGAILAVPQGQNEAARTLGFSRWQTMRHFILPQATPLILGSIGVNAVILLKSTALVSTIGVVELTAAGQRFVNSTYKPFEVLGVAALFYLVLIFIVAKGMEWVVGRYQTGEGKTA